MIQRTTSATQSRVEARPDNRRHDRDATDAPSFETELAAEDRRAPAGLGERRDAPRAPKERDEARDGPPLLQAANDPHALDPRRLAATKDAAKRAGAPSGAAAVKGDDANGSASLESLRVGPAAQPLILQAPGGTVAQATAAMLPQGATAFDPEALLAGDTVELSAQLASAGQAAEGPKANAPKLASDLVAALVLPEAEPAEGDDTVELDDDSGDDTAGLAALGDDTTQFASHTTQPTQVHRVATTIPIDATRPLADQVADAVAKLAAEAHDRPDLVRFRSADFSFSAIVRQDGGHTQVRLMSDDPNTRAFLGDRLPEVRQALERVGFASTGLSVAADADRQHRERAPWRPPDEHGDEAPTPLPASTVRLESQSGDGDRPSSRSGLHLIL